jgi:hypothetical protein
MYENFRASMGESQAEVALALLLAQPVVSQSLD